MGEDGPAVSVAGRLVACALAGQDRVRAPRGCARADPALLPAGRARRRVRAVVAHARPRRPRRRRGPAVPHPHRRDHRRGSSAFDAARQALRPLPRGKVQKHGGWHRGATAGSQDPEMRYRQRYVDLVVQPRGAARSSRPARAIDPAPAARSSTSAGFLEVETPGPAAALRRRRGPAVRHAPQRAGHAALPAHRRRALPEAAASWAGSSGSTRSARTSATRGWTARTTPSSPCWSATRPTRTTTT